MYSIVRRQDRNGGWVGAHYTTNTTVCLYKISNNNHSQKQHMLLTSLCTTTRRGETNGYFIIERQYRQSRTGVKYLFFFSIVFKILETSSNNNNNKRKNKKKHLHLILLIHLRIISLYRVRY